MHISSSQKNATYALLFRRLMAYVLDIIVLFAFIIALNALLWIASRGTLHSSIQSWWQLQLIILLTAVLPAWFYFSFSEITFRRATLGKLACRIHVTRRDLQPVTLGQSLLRNVVKLIPWQLTHLALFVPTADGFASVFTAQTGMAVMMYLLLALSYILMLVYVVRPLFTGGQRSIHDDLSGTMVK